jgi:hypothetical protein
MLGRQTKLVEAFQRTVQFVKTHVPPNANGMYAVLGKELELAVAELEQAASDQALGRRVSQATTRKMAASVKRLRDRHLKPLAVIARAVGEDEPGISRAMRMPRRRTGVTRLAAEGHAMRETAGKYEALFVSNGRDSGFLSQLDQAIESGGVSGGVGGRATLRARWRPNERFGKIRQARMQGAHATGLTWQRIGRARKSKPRSRTISPCCARSVAAWSTTRPSIVAR